ncbi:MAG: hypothetical protein ACK5O3_11130 [Burkholderiales bacterium]|jgi:hypothetical protein
MRTDLINDAAYELSAILEPNRLGFHLAFESYVPIARRPERQRRFGATISKSALLRLRWLIDDVLCASGEVNLERPVEERLRTVSPGRGPHTDIAFLLHLAAARRRRLGALQALADGRVGIDSSDLHWLAKLLDESLGRLKVPETPLSRQSAQALAAALAELVRQAPCFPFDAEPLIGPLARLRTGSESLGAGDAAQDLAEPEREQAPQRPLESSDG